MRTAADDELYYFTLVPSLLRSTQVLQKPCQGNFRKFQGTGESRFGGSEKNRYFLNIPSEEIWFGRLSFTHSSILIGKHKCFVNTFHVSCIFFKNELNCGCYIRVDKVFGTVKKWLLVLLDRWFCYLGGLASFCYGEVVVL